jgi:hypothetical protein
MVTEFKIPTDNLIELRHSKLFEQNEEKYKRILEFEPYIEELLDFYIRVYLRDYDFTTPFSSILIINEDLTVFIMEFIQQTLSEDLPHKNRRIFDAMHCIAGKKYGFTVDKFEQMSKRLNEKIILKLACSKTYSPSSTRYIYNDEVLGFVSHVLSASFPLLAYQLASRSMVGMPADDKQGVWIDLTMVYIEIWLLKNWRPIVHKIKQHFVAQIKRKDSDWCLDEIEDENEENDK